MIPGQNALTMKKWMEAFRAQNVDIAFYNQRERSLDEILPWDFIDTGVTKDFLKREWKRAMEETVSPNCRVQCQGCGVKKFGGGVCFEGQSEIQ